MIITSPDHMIEELWQGLRDHALVPLADAEQERELRCIFFAAATATFRLLVMLADKHPERVATVERELNEFQAEAEAYLEKARRQ